MTGFIAVSGVWSDLHILTQLCMVFMEAEVSRIISKLFVFCTSAPERTLGLRSSGGLAGIIDAQPASKAKHMTHAINGNNFLAISCPPS